MLDDFRGVAHAMADLVSGYLDAVPDRPVWRPMEAEERRGLLELPLPAVGRPLGELLGVIERQVMTAPMGNGNPRFFGWVNSAPQPAGVLAELAAAAMNPCVAGDEHAAKYLERAVVRWIAELVGFPHPPGAGLLTSGGSMATIVCLAAARHRAAQQAGHDIRTDGIAGLPLVCYATTQTHACVPKAVELLGLGSRNLRTLPSHDGKLTAAGLRQAVAEDRAQGLLPFLAVATAGTTATGAVDDLDALADVCTTEGVWLHVDGAYGAFGILDPAIAHRYKGMNRADSLTLNPHKWLGVPVDCGCALVRAPATLRAAFSLMPSYLSDDQGDELGWFCEYGIEQTRPFRALKVWATIAHRGRDGISADIARTTALARHLGELIKADPLLELMAPVETSIVAFRYHPAGMSEHDTNTVNRQVPSVVQHRGKTFITGAALDGTDILRACLLNAATTENDLHLLLNEVHAAADTPHTRNPTSCPSAPVTSSSQQAQQSLHPSGRESRDAGSG